MYIVNWTEVDYSTHFSENPRLIMTFKEIPYYSKDDQKKAK